LILKKLITKEGILEYTETIFRYYFKVDFEEGTYYNSPLRAESSPSFNIYMNRNKGYLVYKDWGGSFGNAIDFVMRLHLLEFASAMKMIVKDLNLPFVTSNEEFKESIKFQRKIKLRKLANIVPNLIIEENQYTDTDIAYWNDMFIPVNYIRRHNIFPVLNYFINSIEIRRDVNFPVYAFVEVYKKKVYYKLYAPFADSKNKWKSTMTEVASKVYHNINKIPKKGNLLIITSSVKDNVILSYLGYNVISGQGEDIPLDTKTMTDLKARYTNIIIFYDNDYNKDVNYGILAAHRESERFGFRYVYIPGRYRCTDIGELAHKLTSIETLKIVIQNVIRRNI